MQLDELAAGIARTQPKGRRRLVAIAGPPASGKSTLAETLADRVADACVVPMDGFHLDNSLLDARGLRHRKGAPETFDARGFAALVARLAAEDDVIFPTFDRVSDRAVAGAGHVSAGVRTVILEGNYLLLDRPVWRNLVPFWDRAFRLIVPREVLRDRLIARWLAHGYSPEAAERKALDNDLPNAELVLSGSDGGLPVEFEALGS